MPEDLGSAVEDWLSKKRQYEMLTDRNGRLCQASDDNLVAAMFRLMQKNLEETVMFTNEAEGFQELFGRLLAYSSTKQSVKTSESKRQARRDDPMDVVGLINGKSKGKGKKGKGNIGQNQTSAVKCWNCGKSGHRKRKEQRRQRNGWQRQSQGQKQVEQCSKQQG